MAELITRRSPLTAWATKFAQLPPTVRIAEIPFLTQLDLRVDPDSTAVPEIGKVLGGPLPTVACTASTFGEIEVLWLGPDEWLILAPADQQGQLEAQLREALGDQHGAVTDVSAQRTALTLTGQGATDVLTQGCAIDLHPRVSPAGTCVQTLLAQTGVILVVRDDSATDFLVLVRSSFAEYCSEWLVDSCVDLSP